MLFLTALALLAALICIPSSLLSLTPRSSYLSTRLAMYSGSIVVAYLYALLYVLR